MNKEDKNELTKLVSAFEQSTYSTNKLLEQIHTTLQTHTFNTKNSSNKVVYPLIDNSLTTYKTLTAGTIYQIEFNENIDTLIISNTSSELKISFNKDMTNPLLLPAGFNTIEIPIQSSMPVYVQATLNSTIYVWGLKT